MQQFGSVLESIRQPGVTSNKCSRLRASTVQRIATEVIGLSKERVHRSIVDPRAPSGDNLVKASTHSLRSIVTSRASESTLAGLHPCRSRGAEGLKRLSICLKLPFEERNTKLTVGAGDNRRTELVGVQAIVARQAHANLPGGSGDSRVLLELTERFKDAGYLRIDDAEHLWIGKCGDRCRRPRLSEEAADLPRWPTEDELETI